MRKRLSLKWEKYLEKILFVAAVGIVAQASLLSGLVIGVIILVLLSDTARHFFLNSEPHRH